MAKSATTLSSELVSHLTNIEKTRKNSEILLAKGKLAKRDVNLIYSGLFLEAIISFERFVEDLFICLLSNSLNHPSRRVQPKTTFKNYTLAQNILRGERSYIDWFPYEKYTKKRAKVFFAGGLPFTGLDTLIDINTVPSNDKRIEKFTDKIYIIRNALAHKSSHSYKRFQTEIIDKTTGLHTREKNPIGYLRGHHTTHPVPITRYEQIVSEIKFISILITSSSLK